MPRKKNPNPRHIPENAESNDVRLDFSDIDSVSSIDLTTDETLDESDIIERVQSDDESFNDSEYTNLSDIPEKDRFILEEVVKDDNNGEWDDKVTQSEAKKKKIKNA